MFDQARPHTRLARAVAALAFVVASLATLGFPGCEGDLSSSGSVNPNTMTMDNCWPNDDGRYWNYDEHAGSLAPEPFDWVPLGETPREVTFADARRLLGEDVTMAGDETRLGFGLAFNGEMTTQSGVVAQRLDELYFEVLRPAGVAAVARPADSRGAFLARLAAARPDLRARVAALVPATALPAAGEREILVAPFFIHGYAWRKTAQFIGTYGDVDTLLAWKFLDSNVRPGHEFVHQLVPSLADDVWLRGRVEREVKVAVPGGETRIGLEVLYIVDYGVAMATDAMGNVVGSARMFDYGLVTYVPGVGPVKDLERRFAIATRTLTHGYFQIRFDLVETGVHAIRLAPVAAR